MKTPYLEDANYVNVAAVPGQSLTDTPKNRPYEKPPAIVDPERALAGLVSKLREPNVSSDIIGLLDIGISAETISSSMVMTAFTEGHITPDVAEIIKEPLMRFILRIGLEAGIEDINVVNEFPQEGMSSKERVKLMERMNPQKYAKIMAKLNMQEKNELQDIENLKMQEEEEEGQNNLASEENVGFISPRREV